MNKIENAHVYYNDLTGTSALDFHGSDSNGLLDYAKVMQIDTDKYEPVGLNLYINEFRNLTLKFYCVDNKLH